ncbi:rRNA biogenesis protein rrp36 [Toensbergia leucococca]|nr:rRNA biogenesis protein rrp36 [Toensbergia leucococca]
MVSTEFAARQVGSRKTTSDEELISYSHSNSAASDQKTEDTTDQSDSQIEEAENYYQDIPQATAIISFGALAKAQDIFGKRKRNEQSKDPRDSTKPLEYRDSEAVERRAGKKDLRDFSRSSKHAPIELSSKKAVSRRREVIPITKLDYRDPRFEPLSGPIDESKIKQNYSFLDDYRDSEIAELKNSIRQTRDVEAKEELKRALLRKESRKKTQQAKDKQQDVLRKHRAKEKELILQGKKPFYLKSAEQKKLALVERFEGMKGKQAEKAIERRRKKKAGMERKGMPSERRAAETWL